MVTTKKIPKEDTQKKMRKKSKHVTIEKINKRPKKTARVTKKLKDRK